MTRSQVAAETMLALGAAGQRFEAFENRATSLGALAISRALPVKGRRLVGPWCFLDRYGPLTFTDDKPMDVAPHPHIGLQTVTWLLDGEVVHDDSLRHESILRPGGVNVMTSGDGIAHAEQTPKDNSGRLNGVQLWTALPDANRHDAAGFQHVERVPSVELPGGVVQLFAGTLEGTTSPAQHFSDLLGADVQVHARETIAVPLDRRYEHAVLILDGSCSVEGQPLHERVLYYLGTHRSEVSVASPAGARLLLIGGPPFPEQILMWWNFVARTPEEIRIARDDWEAHRRFGEVTGYDGPRLRAPDLMRLARPNPAS
jgi:redox-sensitive bicupin YhaK (pirin superfamily)